MKLCHSLISFLLVAMLTACANKSNKTSESDSIWIAPQISDEILDLGIIERSDTFTVRGHLYNYTYRLAPVDSMPIITNIDGTRYHDNDVTLTIRRDSTIVLKRRFTKHSFSSMISKSDLQTSALVGFSYNLNHMDDHSHLRFIATIGDPDETSGIYFPVELCISTDGSYSLHTVEDFETESLFEGLNEEPEI